MKEVKLWSRMTREVVESPFFEIVRTKTCSWAVCSGNPFLCNRVSLDDLQKFLLTSVTQYSEEY